MTDAGTITITDRTLDLAREALADWRAENPRRALEDNGGMIAEIARLRGLLIEERTETLWNAYHTGHEKDGMWDHCCMSDGEWLAAECGLPPSQRVYSAEAIKTAIPVAARRAALSRPHATKGEAG